MTVIALSVFLILHGLLHPAIWIPQPKPEGPPPPFVPDESAVLTAAAVPRTTVHHLAVTLSIICAVAYVSAGVAVAIDLAVAVPLAIAAAVVGLTLKLVYFHPWLIFGVLLDGAVLSAALTGWPVSL